MIINMKKLFFYSMLLSLIFLTTHCDKIEKPYTEDNNQIDTSKIPDFPVLGNVIQKYLLEDFTGHLCVNCPQAHAIADTMKMAMGDTLVVIAIHSGNYAKPIASPFDADFRTEMGDLITSDFNITNYPSGMISRKEFNGDRKLDRTTFKASMESIVRQAPTIGLQIIAADSSADSINVFVKTTFLSAMDKNLKLYVVLIENGIISAQKNNYSAIGTTPEILNYEHKHVLRTNINPKEGNVIAKVGTPVAKDESVIKGYTLYLSGKSWNLDNCDIIAFVVDSDTKEILQVEEVEM
jgi:hypothetical protein